MKNDNYLEKDYEKNFKKDCAMCGEPIKKGKKSDWDYYRIYGNYCPKCNGITGANALDALYQEDLRNFGYRIMQSL